MVADLNDVPDDVSKKRKSKNVFIVAGERNKLVKRTQTANSFHTMAELRTSKKSRIKTHKVNWLVVFLCLLAGLVIGAELYFYLSKGVLLTK